jgi:hypothetical protein
MTKRDGEGHIQRYEAQPIHGLKDKELRHKSEERPKSGSETHSD